MNIPDDLIRKAMKASGARTKTRAVILALEELIRKKQVERLLERAGTLEFGPDEEFNGLRHER